MHVEIWSDIACPWCYVGKRRFEAALARFEHREQVQVTWRSFELDPGAPAEREGERAARLAEKYGTTVERAREMERHMTERGGRARASSSASTSRAAARRSTPTGWCTSRASTACRTR